MLKDILVQDYPLLFKDTSLLIEGVPYYVCSFRDNIAECLDIGSQDYVNIDFQKIVSIKIPHVGYFNHRGCCGFVQRNPVRRFKHGLCRENTSADFHNLDNLEGEKRDRYRDTGQLINRFQSKSHYNMLMNIYPSLKDAVELLQDGGDCIAFDRQFAIDVDFNIYYKTNNVGKCLIKDGGYKITLQKKYEHLRVALPKEYQ